MPNAPAAENGAPPSGPPQRPVILALAAFAVLALGLLPVAGNPGPVLPGIVALFVAGFVVTELSTSFLLLVRFHAARTWSLLVLRCAFFYSGLMAVPHLLTFPGAVLAEAPLVGSSTQSTSWIFNLWINGFALLCLVAAGLEGRLRQPRVAAEAAGRAIGCGLGLAAAVVLAIALGAIAAVDRLPVLISGPSWTNAGSVASWLAVVFMAASIAVILLAIGERNRLFLWLSLALGAMAFANVVSTAGGGRFTIGWTVGRLSWLAAACVLFVYLLLLRARDQRLLTETRDLLGDGAADAAPAGGGRTIEAALERFVARENVARYTRMLEDPQDEARWQVLLKMLAEEEARLQQLGGSPR
jgi:hypothetical protein